jgi:multiple sugar transport system substrate-binding protein
LRNSGIVILALALATAAVLLWPGAESLLGKKVVRFTVWGMPFEDRLFHDRYAKRWEALHPEVAVDYGRFADAKMKYNAWATRGTGAEVMRMEITWYPSFAERGVLEPLNRYILDPRRGLSPEQMAKFPPHLLELLDSGGELYALPEDNAQFGLFYNLDLFDAHNRAHPEAPVEYPREGWTWEDLRRTAKALTRFDGAGRLTQAGFDVAIWAWPFLTFFAQAGGEMWSDGGRGDTCLVNSAAGVEALEFLRALQREDRSFAPTLTGYTAGVGADTLFASGRTAMFLDGSWRVPNFDLTAPSLRYAVAPLPRGKVPAVVSGSVLWAISAHATNKDEAWEMLKWLVQDEQALTYWDTLRVAPPANLVVLHCPAFRSTRGVLKDPTDPSEGYDVPPLPADQFPLKAEWLLAANRPGPRTGRTPAFVPMHLYAVDLQEEITRMLNEFLRPDSTLTAQQALDRVVSNVHAVIDRDRRAKGRPPVRRESRP